MPRSRRQRIALGLTRALVYPIAFILLVVGLVFFAFETGWGKNQLRGLIIRQANQYLTATLEIDRLQGSLVRGLELTGVRLSLDGRMLVAIDGVSLSYSIRELIDQGTVIRRIRITRPRVSAGRLPDGRWDLSALVRREARDRQRTGPSRPITLRSIEVIDGTVVLRDPLKYGPAYVPMRYDALNLSLSYAYEPVAWTLNFTDASWKGDAENLTVNKLAGVIASGPGGLSFTDLKVQTPGTTFTLDGRIIRDVKPSVVDLRVIADRFAFQEWTGVIRELRNIVVDAAFDVSLKGPLAQLATGITLHSNGGGVHGALVLDTTVPGMARHRRSRRRTLQPVALVQPAGSSVGHLGTRGLRSDAVRPQVPSRLYAFDGGHTAFLEYEATTERARHDHRSRGAHRRSHRRGVRSRHLGGERRHRNRSTVSLSLRRDGRPGGSAGAAGIRSGAPRREPARARLRRHRPVSRPFIIGHAVFAASEFLGAAIGAGTVGSIDTSQKPLHFAGDGEVDELDVRSFRRGARGRLDAGPALSPARCRDTFASTASAPTARRWR